MLKQARLDAGLTQRTLAARLGRPHSFPNKVEAAERELNVIELLDYCTALGVDFVLFVSEVPAAVQVLRQTNPTTGKSAHDASEG